MANWRGIFKQKRTWVALGIVVVVALAVVVYLNVTGKISVFADTMMMKPISPATITGQVTISSQPGSGQTVILQNGTSTVATVATDSNGGYTFKNVPAGFGKMTYRVFLMLAGGCISPTGNNVTVDVYPGGRYIANLSLTNIKPYVKGKVYYPDGRPFTARGTVAIEKEDGMSTPVMKTNIKQDSSYAFYCLDLPKTTKYKIEADSYIVSMSAINYWTKEGIPLSLTLPGEVIDIKLDVVPTSSD